MMELLEQVDHWSLVDLRTSSNMEVKEVGNREAVAGVPKNIQQIDNIRYHSLFTVHIFLTQFPFF